MVGCYVAAKVIEKLPVVVKYRVDTKPNAQLMKFGSSGDDKIYSYKGLSYIKNAGSLVGRG